MPLAARGADANFMVGAVAPTTDEPDWRLGRRLSPPPHISTARHRGCVRQLGRALTHLPHSINKCPPCSRPRPLRLCVHPMPPTGRHVVILKCKGTVPGGQWGYLNHLARHELIGSQPTWTRQWTIPRLGCHPTQSLRVWGFGGGANICGTVPTPQLQRGHSDNTTCSRSPAANHGRQRLWRHTAVHDRFFRHRQDRPNCQPVKISSTLARVLHSRSSDNPLAYSTLDLPCEVSGDPPACRDNLQQRSANHGLSEAQCLQHRPEPYFRWGPFCWAARRLRRLGVEATAQLAGQPCRLRLANCKILLVLGLMRGNLVHTCGPLLATIFGC